MLTEDQEKASELIEQWTFSRESKPFLLEGGAGVGKTWLLSQELATAQRHGSVVCAAPTHKAINVLRRKLDAAGLSWVRGFDPTTWDHHAIITGTTAALLGISPVISDDQGTEVRFGKSGRGLLKSIIPRLLVIDEVSMLALSDLMDLSRVAKASGMQILIVGDSAQLPPVKKKAIPFEAFGHRATLRKIVRQAEGSAIVEAAWAIRDGRPWGTVSGPGLVRAAKPAAAYLEQAEQPGEKLEEQRSVFISYRNARVAAVNDACCRKLYGHGDGAFAPGELVLSESNLYQDGVLLVANQDELLVEKFDEAHRDPVIGVPVRLRRLNAPHGTVTTHYLSPEDLVNQQHPFNVELAARLERAQKLQEEAKRNSRVDKERRMAWRSFFEWRDSTLLSFRHPFAITSHKSQGSTYKAVYADVADLAKFSRQALYVAVTRPRELLVVPA